MTATDESAFLAAIRAEPECDTRRLAYADWLEEHERSDRAEFIRAQVGWERVESHCESCTGRLVGAGPVRCAACPLRERADALLARHRADWLRVPCATCGGTGRTGQHHDPASDTVRGGRSCDRCAGTGDMGGLTWDIAVIGVSDVSTIEFSRGFPAVVTVRRLEYALERDWVCRCGVRHKTDLGICTRCMHREGEWSTQWGPTPWLRAVVAHHPVTEVVPLDRTAHEGVWYLAGRPDPVVDSESAELPGPLFDLLDDYLPECTITRWKAYATDAAARSALGRAIVAFARRDTG